MVNISLMQKTEKNMKIIKDQIVQKLNNLIIKYYYLLFIFKLNHIDTHKNPTIL
jgi:hypothetical protein